ncbi:MAG: DUF998 domain-containing protein [Thermoleophilia bacterium]
MGPGRSRLLRQATAAGVATPPCLVAALGLLTVANRSYLASVDWSPTGYTDVQWPSILATGRWGAAASGAFLAAGIAGMGLAWAARELLPPGRPRLAAVPMAVVGLATAVAAFPTDPVGAEGPPSWHDRLHDLAFPSLAAGAIAAMAWLALTLPRDGDWRRLARLSGAAAAVTLAAFALTGTHAISQLARFALLAALLLWAEALALRLRGVAP